MAGVPAGPIAAECVSAVFAWLPARSGSMFVAALAHIAFKNANAAAVLIFDVPPVSFLVGLVSLTVVMAGVLVVTGEMGRVADIKTRYDTAGSSLLRVKHSCTKAAARGGQYWSASS